MTGNHDVRVARAFHDATTHTTASIRTSGHTLEWDIKPFPFKVYTDLPTISLPRDVDLAEVDTLRALDPAARVEGGPLTLGRLAALLYLTAGVTRKKTYPGAGEVLFRAAASTGALYQTEVYVAAGNVQDLPRGLYHFCPGDFTLRRLPAVDARRASAPSTRYVMTSCRSHRRRLIIQSCARCRARRASRHRSTSARGAKPYRQAAVARRAAPCRCRPRSAMRDVVSATPSSTAAL